MVMSEITIQELIEKVRDELLAKSAGPGYPLFFVEKVELEVRVAVQVEAGGKLKLSVLDWVGIEGAGKGLRDNGHSIKIVLSPILTHEEQVTLLKQDVHLWDGVQRASRAALRKSVDNILGEEE
jgi:hypothetical protein